MRSTSAYDMSSARPTSLSDGSGSAVARSLELCYDDAQVRKLDVDQLVRLAAGYASRERFLTELTLDPPLAKSA